MILQRAQAYVAKPGGFGCRFAALRVAFTRAAYAGRIMSVAKCRETGGIRSAGSLPRASYRPVRYMRGASCPRTSAFCDGH